MPHLQQALFVIGTFTIIMPFDIKQISPLPGTMYSVLWENSHINLPLSLFYSIEIPLQPFDTGHVYVDQPAETSFVIEWIRFRNEQNMEQEKSWKNLLNRKFALSYDDGNAEGSIYLGSEHCQFNSLLKFNKLNGAVFDIELAMDIHFNIDTINLQEDGLVKTAVTVEYEGLKLFPPEMLPSFQNEKDPMNLIGSFIDLSIYDSVLMPEGIGETQWKRLKPKVNGL